MVDAQETSLTKPNGQFPFASEAVRWAAFAGDFNTVRRLVHEGADLNVFDRNGDSLLEVIVRGLLNEPGQAFQASDMVRLLIDLGADPNLMQAGESVALVPAMLHMDTPMLKALLEGGANPNPLGGVCEGNNIYDWGVFDYELEVWLLGQGSTLALRTAPDIASEDAWLAFIDRIAAQHGVRRPEHLILLRQYGARSAEELKDDNAGRQGDLRSKAPEPPVPPQQCGLHDAINFLTVMICEGCDWSDRELPVRLEAMYNLHSSEPTFMKLFEVAANVYSDIVVAKARAVLRSFDEDKSAG
jgi:hypothetical protein